MSTWREWDWPQESRGRGRSHRTVNVEITVAPAAPRQRTIGDRIANGFFFTMVTLAKLAVAAFCTGLVLGSIAMIVILIKAAMN